MKGWFRFACIAFLSVCFQGFGYEFAIGSMFRDEAPYLREWIEYHRMVGAEHFFLYNDRSVDNWEEVLEPYIAEGLVEVFDWPSGGTSDHSGNQCAAFRDTLRRTAGNTTWVAFIDLDEFILPMKGKNVPDCLNTYFPKASAVYINWRCFGAGDENGVRVPLGQPILFELTQCSLKSHSKNAVGKTVIRPDHADIDQLWYVHTCPLKPGYCYLNGAQKVMPFNGIDLKTDGFTHPDIIRINHYAMRDRNYFENVRLRRSRSVFNGYSMPEWEVLQENELFSLTRDQTMIRFIKKYYPQQAKKYWKST